MEERVITYSNSHVGTLYLNGGKLKHFIYISNIFDDEKDIKIAELFNDWKLDKLGEKSVTFEFNIDHVLEDMILNLSNVKGDISGSKEFFMTYKETLEKQLETINNLKFVNETD